MKAFKRYGWIAAGLLAAAVIGLFVFRPAGNTAVGENLLANGDFSAVTDGMPNGWYKEAWAGLNGADFDVVETEAGPAAHIVNHILKDARFAQTVEVEPNALYCLRGYIKADAESGKGANLSVEDVYVFSESVFDTGGEWQEVFLYGRTGEAQHSVNVFARLGGYSGEALGEAWFRDISLYKVDNVPAGYSAQPWYAQRSAYQASSDSEGEGGNAGLLLAGISLAYAALFAVLCRFLRRPRHELNEKLPASNAWLAAGLLLAACALRLLIAARVPGYDVDIGCFRAWATRMADYGPVNFYHPADPFSYCDYPPGYMLVLWIVGGMGNLLGTGVTEFMVKVPPILADIGLCAVLYAQAREKKLSAAAALSFVCLYAFNPLTVITGAAWGQADSMMTLLLALCVIYALKKQWKAALPFYIAAVLVKPQALMFGPLGLYALVLDIYSRWRDPEAKKAALRDLGAGLAIMLGVALAITVPFSIHLSWNWLFTLYAQTMGRYAYATVNGCNLYFLLGKNWVSAGNSLSGDFLIPFLVFCLSVLPLAASLLLRAASIRQELADRRSRMKLFTMGFLALALGVSFLVMSVTGHLTYASMSAAVIIYCVALVSVLYAFAHDLSNLPVFGAALLLLLFNTGAMMHERYLFPAVGLLLLGYLWKKDTRILWLAVGVTVAGFLNVGCALDRNIRIGGAAGHLNAPVVSLWSDMAVAEYLSAGLNCLICFGALMLCESLSRGAVVSFAEKARSAAPVPAETPLRRMTRRDWILLAIMTGAYSVLAFTNLGATKAPQTAYVASSISERIVLDLGETRDFNMLYYGGIHYYDNDFDVEISEDGQRWTQFYTAGMNPGDCFKWKYLSYSSAGTYPVNLRGRYVRIETRHYSLTLFEVLFKDPETKEILPVTLLDSDGNETAALLLDEQDSMAGDDPSWYNSTYFDEIYHARTGYEHLHRMQPYETTHPPLGKVFISWAIALFGMTPFGWRFAGALAGVLMLPGMYLLGRLLIKRRWGGPAACLLMALDLMHFTQTRIATIDSFVVLFIIWMVYFMLRWFYLDFFRMPFWKTLVPLGLSGFCMGLGVASKWTAVYVGVLLAILFFYGVWRRARMVAAAKKIPEKKRSEEEQKTAQGGRLLLYTVLSCLVFFVLIPLLIYYCAYIPYFAYDGVGVTPKKVIEAAVGPYFTTGYLGGMLGYHSEPGLGMDHDFYSPWYQWPVIGKPMSYASSSFEPEGLESAIVALGNPLIWWGGLLCVALCLAVWIRRHLQKDGSFSLFAASDDPRPGQLLLLYFGQLLPWILVPRGTYIYHYFPCVPFLALSIVLCLDLYADVPEGPLAENLLQKLRIPWNKEFRVHFLLLFLIAAAAALFVFFFPYASGVLAPRSWMEACRWFDRWLYY